MSRKSLRKNLFNKSNRCHWCNKEMILDSCTPTGKSRQLPNTATIDHVFSKLDPKRFENNNHTTWVLACYQCNHDRAIEQEKQQSPARFYLQSQGFTLNPLNPKNKWYVKCFCPNSGKETFSGSIKLKLMSFFIRINNRYLKLMTPFGINQNHGNNLLIF